MNLVPNVSITNALRRLWTHVRTRRRLQLLLLVLLAFAMSFAELATIGAAIPFVAALISPEKVLGNTLLGPILKSLNVTQASQLILPMSVAFGAIGLLAAAIRLLQLYASIRFSMGLGTELSTSIYRRTLYQPYDVHIRRNSSELINAISAKTTMLMNNVVLSVVLLFGSAITAVSVVVGLVFVDPPTTIGTFGALAVLYALILRYARRRLYDSSLEISQESSRAIKLLQEGLGGIRDVLIGHNQEAYSEAYRRSDQKLRRAQGYNHFIGLAPRYLIEGLAMCAVALLAYFLSLRPGGVASALPVMAALTLGAQRLLPIMQQIYNAIINIRGHHVPLVDAVELLEQPLPDDAFAVSSIPLPFQSTIEFQQLAFRYAPDLPDVLTNVTFAVRKGQKVGIIGKTGSGKSTLIDLAMGLLSPTGGRLLVDGVEVNQATRRSWQRRISHVPQTIFLVDGTVAENIALATAGEPVDLARVKQCASMANIAETITQMPGGYAARVGERGIMLSGGQRQRIGIARALYKHADVIVLDEATSALDNQTEQEVMRSIGELGHDLTFFIIAHRLTTLSECDLVIELEDGKIGRSASYAEIIANRGTS